MRTAPPTYALIYDANCPLCIKAAEWVQRRARAAVDLIPCQSEDRARRFPAVAEAQCLEAVQLVTPDGRVLAGERVLPYLLQLMRGWRWLALMFRIPGVSRLAPGAYRWLARRRHMLAILVARKSR